MSSKVHNNSRLCATCNQYTYICDPACSRKNTCAVPHCKLIKYEPFNICRKHICEFEYKSTITANLNNILSVREQQISTLEQQLDDLKTKNTLLLEEIAVLKNSDVSQQIFSPIFDETPMTLFPIDCEANHHNNTDIEALKLSHIKTISDLKQSHEIENKNLLLHIDALNSQILLSNKEHSDYVLSIKTQYENTIKNLNDSVSVFKSYYESYDNAMYEQKKLVEDYKEKLKNQTAHFEGINNDSLKKIADLESIVYNTRNSENDITMKYNILLGDYNNLLGKYNMLSDKSSHDGIVDKYLASLRKISVLETELSKNKLLCLNYSKNYNDFTAIIQSYQLKFNCFVDTISSLHKEIAVLKKI